MTFLALKRTACAAGAASLLTATSAYAVDKTTGPFRLGAGVEGGRVSVLSEKPTELDKSGPSYGMRAFAEINSRWLTFTLGGSRQTTRLSGEDKTRGVGQDLTVNTATGQTGLFLNFTRKLSLGLAGRIHKGPSADYGVQVDDAQKTFRDAGPALRASIPLLTRYNIIAEAAWLRSLNSEERKVSTVLASLSASIPVNLPSFGKTTMAAKIIAQPGQITSTDEFRPTVSNLYFQYASDELAPESIKDVQTIVDALKRQNLGDQRIEISGFGSRTGSPRRTLAVSLQRAEKIAAMLIEAGIPASAMEVAGFGSSELDPLEAPDGDRQRRVVVKLKRTRPQPQDVTTYALSMSGRRIPPSVVYKAEELWGILETVQAMRNSENKSLSVSVDLPASVARQPGTWEKVREGINVIVSAGLSKNGLVTRVSGRRGDILFKITTTDNRLLARLDEVQQMQNKLVAVNVDRLQTDDLPDKLIASSKLWTAIEVPSREIRQRLIDEGIAPGRIRLGQQSDLWSYTTESIQQSGPSKGVIVVHASRSKKRLETALRSNVPEQVTRVTTPSREKKEPAPKPDHAKDAILRLMAKPLIEKEKSTKPDSKELPAKSHRRDPWQTVPLGGGTPSGTP
ncbi:MAG: OmpA family [Pseudomonadota bacterium]|jgi:outer membrane protein OmpA-like peptidoglycan-associated protein